MVPSSSCWWISCFSLQDDFVLRAREKIETDEEITVSYLGEDFDDGLTMLDLVDVHVPSGKLT